MRYLLPVLSALVLLGIAGHVLAGDEKMDRRAVKALLSRVRKDLEPRIKDDAKARDELLKLVDANDDQIARMVRDIKKTFELEAFNAESMKKVESQVAKAIRNAKSDELRKALIERKASDLPVEIQSALCWIWGCP